MKNQFWGDAGDYPKYHLLEELVKGVPGIRQLLILWMLTPPHSTKQMLELPQFTSFVRRHVPCGDRRVRHMREYFADVGIRYRAWGDEEPYFSNARRVEYFASVPDAYLTDAIVFGDPDTGLKLDPGRPSPHHLSYDELGDILSRMSDTSVAVFYQHSWRERNFWEWMATELGKRVDRFVGYVADPVAGFYRDRQRCAALSGCRRRAQTCRGVRLVPAGCDDESALSPRVRTDGSHAPSLRERHSNVPLSLPPGAVPVGRCGHVDGAFASISLTPPDLGHGPRLI
jgi:hypothetical protein